MLGYRKAVPVRIYSLAKDLHVDSKDLVELCKKAGIAGKGSALASLTDEEAQRMRDFVRTNVVAGGGQSSVKPQSVVPPVAPVRDSQVVAPLRQPASVLGSPRRVLKSPLSVARNDVAGVVSASAVNEIKPVGSVEFGSASAAGGSAGEINDAQEDVDKVSEGDVKSLPRKVIGGSPAMNSSSAEVFSDRPLAASAGRPGVLAGRVKGDQEQSAEPIRRDSVLPASGSKIRVLGRPNSRRDAEASSGGAVRSVKRRDPVVNLAALPDAPLTAKKPVAAESPAQKPDIKLTKDVIAGHKQGVRAPLEKLARAESERKRVGSGGLSGFSGDKSKAKRGGGVPIVIEDDEPRRKGIAGMASARADRTKGRRASKRNEIEPTFGRDDARRRKTIKRKGTNTAAPRKEKLQLEVPCSLRSFCEAAGVPVAQALRVLLGMQVMANINSVIDLETAELLSAELSLDLGLKSSGSIEDQLINPMEDSLDDEDSLVGRPPVVTFLGHVDHGKTSLLDRLIGKNIARGEAGGITQHIRSYQIDRNGMKVTFVDTPGHAAFTEMRARGANVTDIAVLVVAADDGIMPQTEEAISHAKAAGVPIVVALNKIDLEGVDVTRVLTQLTEHHLTPSEWGGDVEVVRTSATTGEGLDALLETILTVAELHEYKANPQRNAIGVCLEARQDGERGVIATLIVQNGTLRVGNVLVCGASHGRVRNMCDPLTGRGIKVASPSCPVDVYGFDQPPGAGDRFHVLDDIVQAREIALSRAAGSRAQALSGSTTKVSFEKFQELLQEGQLGRKPERSRLNLIVRADTRGSLEAIDNELAKFDHPEVEIRVLQRSVGGVTLADVTLACASEGVILAFNSMPDDAARNLAEERGIEIRRYDIIYKLADDIRLLIEGKLRPEERIVELGRALVKQVFQISRVGSIAGCYVLQGVIQRGCRVRVNRDGRTIGDYQLDTLRRIKEDVKEVARGLECGIKLAGFNDIKQDDVLEAYRVEQVARKLES